MILQASEVAVRYPETARPALDGVDLEVRPGELEALVGPNGSGKTSLVRALVGLLQVTHGRITLEGKPIRGWRPAERARAIGVVPQREELAFSWPVEEFVMFGRYARLGALAPPTRDDHHAVARALERCDVADLGSREVGTLSGGEWQRVRIARALAQEPRILILDEPTAALDIGHEMEVFELTRALVDDGLAGLVVTHHLNLAARFADHMTLLRRGRVAAEGKPPAVLRDALLTDVFQWPVSVTHLDDGAPQIVPDRKPGRKGLVGSG